jgi:hypothetical protein
MRPSTPPSLRRHLPLDALLPWIRRAAHAVASDQDGDQGIKELARRFSMRFGGQSGSVERQMQRMLNGDFLTIAEDRADQWCLFLGLHLDVVWPEDRAA